MSKVCNSFLVVYTRAYLAFSGVGIDAASYAMCGCTILILCLSMGRKQAEPSPWRIGKAVTMCAKHSMMTECPPRLHFSSTTTTPPWTSS